MNINNTVHVDLDALDEACKRFSYSALGHRSLCLFYCLAHKYEQLGCPTNGLYTSNAEMCHLLRLSSQTLDSVRDSLKQLVDCGLIKFKPGDMNWKTKKKWVGHIRFCHLKNGPIPSDSGPMPPIPSGNTSGNTSAPVPAAATQWTDRTAGNKHNINL